MEKSLLRTGITACARFIIMMKMQSFLVRLYSLTLLVFFAIAFSPIVSQAKDGDEQDQIILLNDSAAALEDSHLELSKDLTQFANEKQKDWENKNANKDQLPAAPITDKDKPIIQGQIKILKSAALAIEPAYPVIAKGLNKMAKDMDGEIKNEK